MNKKQVIATLALATTLAGLTVLLVKKCRERKRLAAVSDAGYETAYDVLYPS